MKLWLDDVRPAPEGWVRTYSVNQTIKYLNEGGVVQVSLDHDLGEYESDGGDGIKVIDWMAEFSVWPSGGVSVHSANPVGRERMLATLDRYSPYGW